jgi:chemotaxis signal transduction protein
MNTGSGLPFNRYILTSLGAQTLVFPDAFISEVLLLDRTAILSLPFYDPAMLGVVHKQGVVIPLLLLRRALGEQAVLVPESLTVIRLSDFAENLEGVGLIVDKLVGSVNLEQYEQMLSAQVGSSTILGGTHPERNRPDSHYISIESVIAKLSMQMWQPQRWHTQAKAS